MDCAIINFDCGKLAFFLITNAGYLFLTFLPPVIWLFFYLREDDHPEPKRLIMTAFVGGILVAIPTAVIQYYGIRMTGQTLANLTAQYPIFLFLFMAFTEEYAKYFVVQNLIALRREFDEPIDAMIYLMSSAMGFAAIENALFSFPVFRGEFFAGLELVAGRFLGANLLHVLASGVLGYFIARAYVSPNRRSVIFFGLLTATALHAAFNYLILIKGVVSQGASYLILFLIILAIVVFVEFERLRRRRVNFVQ
ncbi:MAG: PrsW family glutamic-type intramembrane protease [Patescibacteria group bacterium]